MRVSPRHCSSFALAHFVVPLRVSRHAVLGQIDGSRHEIVDGGKPRFALNVVIDNTEILEMRVAVAQRAVDNDEGEEPLQVFAHMRGVRKLRISCEKLGSYRARLPVCKAMGRTSAGAFSTMCCCLQVPGNMDAPC